MKKSIKWYTLFDDLPPTNTTTQRNTIDVDHNSLHNNSRGEKVLVNLCDEKSNATTMSNTARDIATKKQANNQ